MKKEHAYFVYILTDSQNKTLYTGVTNNLERRLREYRTKEISGFSKKYNCTRLVWYELHQYIDSAIYREKQI